MIQYPQMTTQQGTPGASAVNIQIFNPQAYASPQGVQQAPMAQNLDNQIYSYPQTSLYAPGQATYNYPVQQPVQQVMPQPVLNDATNVQTSQAQPVQQQPELQAVATPETPQVAQNAVDVAALNAELQNPDVNVQTEAITKVAHLSQSTPDVALQVVDNQIMQSLLGIIQKDTTQLEGPNQQQIAVAEKIKNGQQLTPEEQAISEQSSPRELAEKNKVFSIFTLAMLQKLQRDELDTYNAQNPTNQIPAIKMEELTGFNEIAKVATTADIPAVKIAAIQALSYVARPEDAQVLNNTLGALANDPDPAVKQAVTEALGKVTMAQAPQAQPAA